MGTSPLYTFESTFHHTPTQADVLGVTGLIFWTMTLIVLIKYVLIVLRADDSGEGGTFALYALLCRALGITPLGNQLGEADKSLARYSTSPAAVDQLAWRNQSEKNSPYRCLSINTRPPNSMQSMSQRQRQQGGSNIQQLIMQGYRQQCCRMAP